VPPDASSGAIFGGNSLLSGINREFWIFWVPDLAKMALQVAEFCDLFGKIPVARNREFKNG
jgi:hypothetical protein